MILDGLVAGVHIPQHLHHIYFAVQLLAPIPKRRAQIRRIGSSKLINCLVGAGHLGAGLLHGQLAELLMLIGMVANKMAFLVDLFYKLWIFLPEI